MTQMTMLQALDFDTDDTAGNPPSVTNVAHVALRWGRADPNRVALVTEDDQGRFVPVTFGALLAASEQFGAGLARSGLRSGDRIALLFRPSVDLYALLLASLASGLVVVMVDASLSRSGIRRALRTARPTAVVSYRRVLRWWPIIPELFGVRRIAVDGACFGATHLSALLREERATLLDTPLPATGEAVISFTSGTTGEPKAAHRGHALLLAQHRVLKATFPVNDDTRNMPCFPLVVLHNLCCGVTSVLPPLDPRDPTDASVARTVRALESWQVTDLCVAPDALARLAGVAESRRSPIDCVRRIAVGGGPVDRALAGRILRSFPNAAVDVVYGCTEAEPIARVSLTEVRDAEGDGCLVGVPVPEIDLALVALPPHAVGTTQDVRDFAVTRGNVGEVVVRGDHVFFPGAPAAESHDSAMDRWHRTGDLARIDDMGRLWLLGRTSDVVMHGARCVYPLVIEASAREIRGVARAALIAYRGRIEGDLIVTLDRGASEVEVTARLRSLLDARGLHTVRIRRVRAIPTDGRHRSKVDRRTLRTELEKGL